MSKGAGQHGTHTQQQQTQGRQGSQTEQARGQHGTQEQQLDLFRLLVESVRDYAIFLLDPEGHILTWNEGAQRIKDYTADEIIGKHFSIFYPPQEVRRGKTEYALRVATDEGRWEDEGWRLRKDGTRFWASVVITALYDDAGRLVGFAKVTRDLTERKQAEELRAQLLALEQAARAQDEFLSVAAHELKTPVTSAKTAAQLLLRRYLRHEILDPADMQRALRTIVLQIDKLVQLVTHLLETVRLQAGRITLDRARTNLTELVQGAVEQAQATTERHELVFCADGPAWAYIDALRFEQVVTNLLDNALKFSPAGGRIDVSVTRPTPQSVQLAVRDRGIGVPPEHRPHLFDRFYQAHAQTHQSGLGLGLYISREIVAQHEGEIVAEFPSDGGTRMVVTLPGDTGESPPTPEEGTP